MSSYFNNSLAVLVLYGWRVAAHFNPGLFNPHFSTPDFSSPHFSTMKYSTRHVSIVMNLELKSLELKLGFEKSRMVEASG